MLKVVVNVYSLLLVNLSTLSLRLLNSKAELPIRFVPFVGALVNLFA